jgi:putative tryptophan/tyrosine transport system substrate-binding protein
MKRILVMLAMLLVAVGAFATAPTEEQTVIGISKIVTHPALDAAEQGIKDEMAYLGYTDVVFDVQDANGDFGAAMSIASKFKADNVTLAVGIATPTAMALVQSITDIPVVFTLVTDPVDAQLVPSLAGGGGNVTGYSDLTPVREQLELLAQFGEISALGHVYSSGEANAVLLADMAKEVCADLGIEFVATTVTNTAEVRQATQAIVDRVDVIYVSTDNTVVSALTALVDVATAAGVPVLSADPSSAEEQGVLAAYGFDYYNMGRATGRLIVDILQGADPNDIPVQFMTDADDLILHVNLDVAAALGITLPASLIERAQKVVENGVLR